jgi:hypothetical protein
MWRMTAIMIDQADSSASKGWAKDLLKRQHEFIQSTGNAFQLNESVLWALIDRST